MNLRLTNLFWLVAVSFSAWVCEATPIPTDRLPPLGYWNPGVVATDGTTYRNNGYFKPSFTNWNAQILDVTQPPYNAVGDGVHDDTANVQFAINNAHGNGTFIVYFPPGTYRLNGSLTLANFNYPWNWTSIKLMGASPTNTFIKGYGASAAILNAASGGMAFDHAVTLSTPAHRGDTQIALSSWDSLYNKETIGIVYYANANADTPYTNSEVQGYESNARCQMVHILSANSSTHVITFDTPLYGDMTNCSFTVALGSGDSVIGIENLSIENAGGGNVDTIKFIGVRNCWVRNCELKNAVGWHIRFQQCMNCTVEGCYIHGYYPSPNNGGGGSVYGCGFFGLSTDNLCVNTRFDRCRHAMPVEYGDTGNVFAYNYNSNPINEGQENTDYLMGDELQHGVTQWNLWEGNMAADFNMDDVLGGSVNNMCFRVNLTRSSHLNTTLSGWGFDIQVRNFQVSIVGAVIANTGHSPTWRVGASDGNGNFPGSGGGDTFVDPTGTPADPRPSLYMHGIVDVQSNLVMWASSNADHALPKSVWLSVRPAFMTTNYVWPAIGPDITGYTNVIPAFVNYFGHNRTATSSDTIPTVNYSLTVNNGTGSGSNPSDATVQITAASAPAGSQFSNWSGDVGTVADINSATTSITMPTKNITITANFVPTTSSSEPATPPPSAPVTPPPAEPVTPPSSSATSTNGPVAWYAFDDGSGSTAADSSGNGNAGTLVTSPAWNSGVISGALNFNGNKQYVSLPRNSSTTLAGLNTVTVSAWIKTTTGGTIVCSGGACINYGNYALIVTGGTALAQFVNVNSPAGQFSLSSTTRVNDSRWHMITCVLNGTSMTLYVDGVSNGTRNDFSGTIFNDGGNSLVDIGATGSTGACGSPATSYFKGSIDDVRIYNRALSADEIQTIYNAVPPIIPAPPGKLFVMPH